jgi:pyruvate-ferredoxin/flavodoxin oxidoreductase
MNETEKRFVTLDGNEAAARVAYAASEVIAIYPITPASPMGEVCDAWASFGKPNVFGGVPDVIEMQSEAGAAGAVHGAIQAGALTTTFTASQGLLLMIPNMFKIAGELTPTVFHIAARSLATHALSIFGDQSDVMAVRSAGWTMLCSASVQEAHDFAAISHAVTLKSRVPILHFFDGFRTSHEVNKISPLSDAQLRSMLDLEAVAAHRQRALDPDRPVLRGSAQNPDVFFQAREASNMFHAAVPQMMEDAFEEFAVMTGRRYRLYEYVGPPDAQHVVVLMGSGSGAAEEAVERLIQQGEKVGLVKVRLYRPFDIQRFLSALPHTVQRIAVLDRTKEPGAIGEPLYQDVVTALFEGRRDGNGAMPKVIGGRYGLSSKEFTPAMAKAVFDELNVAQPRPHFTVGIHDDVTRLSLPWDEDWYEESSDVTRCIFYGLGSDGTVGANKNSVKIIGEYTPLHAQGYFVYDSKKAGAVTVSHLRFSPHPIRSTYQIHRANFVACHQFHLLEKMDVLETAADNATFLLNSPYGPGEVWNHLPREVQEQIIRRKMRFFVIDGDRVAREAGMAGRINTVMQTCFFALANILPRDEAIQKIKDAIRATYGKRGETVVQRNFAAVDHALSGLSEVEIPDTATSDLKRSEPVPADSPDFVKRITAMMLAGRGDLLPVSALPVDGTFPTATAQYEKRSIAHEIPIWDPEICIQCGLCALVCPHASIRTKAYPAEALAHAPNGFPSLAWKGKEYLASTMMTVQVAPEDCTGCGVCVDVCPAKSKEEARHKAINMSPKTEHLDRERVNWDFFIKLAEAERGEVKLDTVKGSQLLQPLFEFSGACAGCGETPYLKLLSQLYGDRILIANATGCSSIYGGNLPTTPWAKNREGRGPAWNNSLFEDNAEFGLGMRLALDQKRERAEFLVKLFAADVGEDLVNALLTSPQTTENEIADQRALVAELRRRLTHNERAEARELEILADALVTRGVWIIGGDGWAYDIGFGGLDHVMASGRDVNILVLDTEVYSNTGGQASKSTPRGATAKFAASGKAIGKKDLGMIAMAYGNVYVAQIAMGAQPLQSIKAMQEAASYPGPSLILAYSHCVAHGIDMSTSMTHQKDAAATGYWPLWRYDPRLAYEGARPFRLDSRKPTKPLKEFTMKEARFAMLARAQPQRAAALMELAQRDVDARWRYYEQLAGIERQVIDGTEIELPLESSAEETVS